MPSPTRTPRPTGSHEWKEEERGPSVSRVVGETRESIPYDSYPRSATPTGSKAHYSVTPTRTHPWAGSDGIPTTTPHRGLWRLDIPCPGSTGGHTENVFFPPAVLSVKKPAVGTVSEPSVKDGDPGGPDPLFEQKNKPNQGMIRVHDTAHGTQPKRVREVPGRYIQNNHQRKRFSPLSCDLNESQRVRRFLSRS